MARIGRNLATLYALDDIGEHRVGAARHSDLLALPHHETVEKLNLCAPAFLHVLAHGRTLLGGSALAVLEALLVAGTHRCIVSLARARDGLRRQMQNLL